MSANTPVQLSTSSRAAWATKGTIARVSDVNSIGYFTITLEQTDNMGLPVCARFPNAEVDYTNEIPPVISIPMEILDEVEFEVGMEISCVVTQKPNTNAPTIYDFFKLSSLADKGEEVEIPEQYLFRGDFDALHSQRPLVTMSSFAATIVKHGVAGRCYEEATETLLGATGNRFSDFLEQEYIHFVDQRHGEGFHAQATADYREQNPVAENNNSATLGVEVEPALAALM